jgi:hypothetical protein
MNEHSKRLLTLAQKNATLYAANLKVRAIMVTGSVACGQADSYSDIDMSIYYEELPSDDELKATYEQNQGSDRRTLSNREEGWVLDQYFLECVKCDIGHVTIRCWEHDMATMLEQCDPDNVIQKAMSGILDALPLYGVELIKQWQAKAANYPDELAIAMVKKHLQFRALWVPEVYGVKRDDVLFLYDFFIEATKNILGVLLGLNRLYHPVNSVELKGMDKFIEKMTIAPHNLSFRLKRIFREKADIAVKLLGELIEETFALVEAHMQEIDTKKAREYYKIWSNRY